MARGPTIQGLQDRLTKLRVQLDLALREVEKIRAQEALLQDMLSEAKGDVRTVAQKPRPNVKQTLLNLLEEAGESGLNALAAVEMARRKGIAIERGTVSSLLSRMKNEGLVAYDNSMYRLVKSVDSLSSESATVTPLRIPV